MKILLKTLVELDNGDEINLLPYGIQKEFKTKCLIGNGVIIDPNVLLNDFKALENNGIDYVKKAIIFSLMDSSRKLWPNPEVVINWTDFQLEAIF